METPDQVIEKLEIMGEDEVRQRLSQGHFHSKKIPLVTGWLQRKDQGRAEQQAVVARQKAKVEEKRHEQIKDAMELAQAAQKQAKLATGVAGGSVLLAVVAIVLAAVL